MSAHDDPPGGGPAPAPVWRATSSSRRGSSHTGEAPNQDAVLVELLDEEQGSWVVAVSDGHGGPRYVRSHVGARLAVRVARDSAAAGLAGAPDQPPEQVLRGRVPALVEAWRRAVSEHLAEHPLDDGERGRADDLADRPYDVYGATLLVALVTPAGVGIAQVGDGDALLRVNGYATRPVPGDDRLVAGATTSLCLETAEQDFRFAAVPGTVDIDLVLLASDGYGNSFAATDWWRTLVDDLSWFVDRHGFDDLDRQLPSWLADSAEVGGDDVSVAVLVLDPLAAPAVDPATLAAERAARTPEAVGPPAAATTVVQPAVAMAPAPEGHPAAPAPRPALPTYDEEPARPDRVTATGGTTTGATADDGTDGRRRRRAVTVGATTLGVVALTAAGVLALSRGGDSVTPTPPPVSSPTAGPTTARATPSATPSTEQPPVKRGPRKHKDQSPKPLGQGQDQPPDGPGTLGG